MAAEIQQAVEKNGYWPVSMNDASIGDRADKILKPAMDFRSGDALGLFELATQNYHDNANIIRSTFEAPVAIFYRGFGRTSHIHCFFNNIATISTKIPMLVICIFSYNTKVAFYEKSHLHFLMAKNVSNGNLAPNAERLQDLVSNKAVSIESNHSAVGGLVLQDGRIGWQVNEGKAAFIGITDSVAAREWSKMRIPKTEENLRIMERMRVANSTLCSNFAWDLDP